MVIIVISDCGEILRVHEDKKIRALYIGARIILHKPINAA